MGWTSVQGRNAKPLDAAAPQLSYERGTRRVEHQCPLRVLRSERPGPPYLLSPGRACAPQVGPDMVLRPLTRTDMHKRIYRQGFVETETRKITLTFRPCCHLWLVTNVTHARPNSHLDQRSGAEPVYRSHPGLAPAPALTQRGPLGNWVYPRKGGVDKFFLWVTAQHFF